VFGHDVNTLGETSDDVVQRHLEQIFPGIARRVNSPLAYWRYLRLPADRRLDRALAALRTWLDEVIDQARARVAARAPTAEPENFLEAMLATRDDEGRPFSKEAIVGNALTMLLAGEDTTAHTTSWAVHELAESPQIVAALRRELDGVLEDAEIPVSIEQSDRLVYATAVANEAMRVRTVSPVFLMEPNEDVTLRDVRVPKGTSIQLVMRPSMMDERHFDRPSTFLPERFLGSVDGKAHDPSVHLPFGTGPRICPGRSLAYVEMRVLLATLYKNFEVERVGKASDVTERFAFAMMPVGLKVRLRRRSRVH
jgi:cytochrome P450